MAFLKCSLLVFFVLININYILSAVDPDIHLNITELIKSKGYFVEEHSVVTEDGYILTMHRIITKPSAKNFHNIQENGKILLHAKPVVFLLHGLLDSSSTWVLNLPHQSLGYILANAGYDVWLGNVRGNTYSKKHVKFSSKDIRFWDFSWDEMAQKDLPAMLYYVNRQTNQLINYIGFSQGTLTAFSAFSTNPNLSKIIRKFIALGPVATIAHISGFFKYLAKYSAIPEKLYKWLGVYEFISSSPFIKWVAKNICRHWLFKKMCIIPVLVGGLNKKNVNETRIPVYIAHTPAGTSVKNVVHFAQMYHSKRYASFDYKEQNWKHYNMTTPPSYNISQVNVATYMIHGTDDMLSTPQDVGNIINKLPKLKRVVAVEGYQHLDFVWGMDAHVRVYPIVIDILHE